MMMVMITIMVFLTTMVVVIMMWNVNIISDAVN